MDNMRYKKVNSLTMDTKKIAAMLAAVEKGSLTAAAQELGYTQSGLTHLMNALESELGLNLLVRSKSGVHLSPVGQQLLPYMEALLDATGALEQATEWQRERSVSTAAMFRSCSVKRAAAP